MKNIPTGYLIEWERTRPGWHSTPAGFSLHLTRAEAEQFIEQHWNALGTELPESYLREKGPLKMTGLTEELAAKLQKRGSMRYGPKQLEVRSLETGHLMTSRATRQNCVEIDT